MHKKTLWACKNKGFKWNIKGSFKEYHRTTTKEPLVAWLYISKISKLYSQVKNHLGFFIFKSIIFHSKDFFNEIDPMGPTNWWRCVIDVPVLGEEVNRC